MKGQKRNLPVSVFPDNHSLLVLGHELGNVLNGLFGMAELLGDSGLNAEQVRWLKAIEHSGRHMQSLICSPGVSAIGQGSGVFPEKSCVDGIEMLEQVVISHTPQARSGKNNLLLLVDSDLPRLWNCDPCLVRQLLDNLVGNALKFTRGGEVVVEASSQPGNHASQPMLRLQVVDSGPGLGVVAGKQIFEAYERGSNSEMGRTGGRGLGLFICKNIVLAMNGRISCSSPESGGTRIEIVLPGTFMAGENLPATFRSKLLAKLQCELKLSGSLRPCMENFLDRLEIPWSQNPFLPSPRALVLEIMDRSMGPVTHYGHAPDLSISARSCSAMTPRTRVLKAPILQSSLEAILLEMVLEWRCLEVRSENPDSIPPLR